MTTCIVVLTTCAVILAVVGLAVFVNVAREVHYHNAVIHYASQWDTYVSAEIRWESEHQMIQKKWSDGLITGQEYERLVRQHGPTPDPPEIPSALR
jgi:hypothetical protein